MDEYKKAFKIKCTECIWKMINDEYLGHMKFYEKTRSVELLWSTYLLKLKASNSLLTYTDLYKEYLGRLDAVYRKSKKT